MNFVDTFPLPTYALNSNTLKFWEYGFAAPVPVCAGTISTDHIVFKKEFASWGLFHFLNTFDAKTWSLIFFAVILVALFNHLLEPKNSFQKHLFWNILTALQPLTMFQRGNDRILACLWSATTLVLTNLFCGRVYESMTLAPSRVVLDSWADLAARVDVPVVASDNMILQNENKEAVEKAKRKFLNPDSIFYETLTRKLDIFPAARILKDNYRDELFWNASRGVRALMAQKETSEYFVEKFRNGKYKDKLYVSRFGGDVQPYFLSMMTPVTSHHFLAKRVLSRLTESGIFDLWCRLIVDKKEEKGNAFGDRKSLPIRIFGGLCVLALFADTLSFLVYLQEVCLFKKERKKRKKRKRRKCWRLLKLRQFLQVSNL